MVERLRNCIAGQWRRPSGCDWIEDHNPADRRDRIGWAPCSDPVEIDRALAAARSAWPIWSATAAPERARLLRRASGLLQSRAAELAALITRENGKTLAEARAELIKGRDLLEHAAAIVEEQADADAGRASFRTATLRQPLGVVGLITPWNFPLAVPLAKLAPALAAGCCAVLKPSPLTPAVAETVCRLLHDAGVPPGVVNLVHGDGSTGAALVDHPAAAGISFTGSSEVGHQVYARAAARGARAQCEMGGQNALLVLAGADLRAAAIAAVAGATGCAGQRCTATARAIVESAVADRWLGLALQAIERLRPGPGTRPESDLGPLISAAQRQRALELIRSAVDEGAKLMQGGAIPEDPVLAHGWFLAPTLFDHVLPTMRIAREELFFPGLAVLRARDFDHALQLANDSDYGLVASIFSRNQAQIDRAVRELEVGVVQVNRATVGSRVELPFGGVKSSSLGPREHGPTALEFYQQVKAVYLAG